MIYGAQTPESCDCLQTLDRVRLRHEENPKTLSLFLLVIDEQTNLVLAQTHRADLHLFTEVEIQTVETMLGSNSVKLVCEKLHYSPARYHEITRGLVDKWKRSTGTNNRLIGWYKTARARKNLLARHLTEVRRVSLIEPVTTQPQTIIEEVAEEPQF